MDEQDIQKFNRMMKIRTDNELDNRKSVDFRFRKSMIERAKKEKRRLKQQRKTG